ncbi:MAG TPA: hypothetical protein VMT94_02910 [Burkholderiales bacterium]|nr:hypothetical protein [Burkholderiales bacterium]
MANKLLVSVSAKQISAARWSGGGFAACTVFANDDEGLAAFKQYLARISGDTVYVMADAVGEDYRLELLPHSFGSDRSEMIGRKLRQHYRNNAYCGAWMQERDSGKRRDDRYLFCALTTPDLIEPWIQAVVERGLPIAGVYLLPTAGQILIEKLQLKQPNLLVVSLHSSGMRLTYFRNQKLRISRLAQIDSGGQQPVRSVAEEISNTRLYLHGMRALTLDEPLTVLVIDRDDTLHDLTQVIARDNPNLECRRLVRAEIIEKLGIKSAALASSTDALYLHLLGLSAPANNLAPASITIGHRQRRAQQAVYALAGAAALVVTAWCTINVIQVIYTHGKAEDAARDTVQQQTRYQEITRQFPSAPTTAENLRRTVEIAQKLGGITRTPEALMAAVSQALDLNPAIALKTFSWKYGAADITSGSEGASSSSGNQAASAAGTRHQSGIIEGEVRPFQGDYRAAIETINRFVAALSQQPEVAQVKIVHLPLNISPDLSLSGNTSNDNREQTGKAEFKLLIILKQTV